jgi:ParB family chromosome partitioning protein
MKPALGRGLGSLIPNAPRPTLTEQVIPEARREVVDVPLDRIRENPRQPRQFFSPAELEDLIASVKEHGVVMPVVVTRVGDGYELIAGERRTRACRALGLRTIPAIVREASEQEKLELALIENVQRQDLNAVEEAIAYRALVDEFGLTQEQVAARVGKNRSTVANILRLLDLPEDVLAALREGRIAKSHARTLLAETDPAKQHALFQALLGGGITVREVEARVGGKVPRAGAAGKDPNILAHEGRLREIFGTKVEIQETDGRGKISISFYSKEELRELLTRLSD